MTCSRTVGVIGAGPAGLTAAYELAGQGVQVDVFEAGPKVGGMAGSFSLWGQVVDYGPHRFFSTDDRVNRVWHEVIGDDYDMVDRLTRIYYRRTFFDYPLKAMNALKGLGVGEAIACVASYGWQRLFPEKDESTFEGWVSNRFGKRLFRIFFKSYSEKLWGIPCRALDADFAAQRIKRFSLSEAIKAALLGARRITHKTLVDQFAYPTGGSGDLYDKMAEALVAAGGRLHLATPVRRVTFDTDGRPRIELGTGEVRTYDHVISSMPLTALVAGLNPPAEVAQCAARLRYRNTILAYLEVEGAGLFPDQWIYVHSPELRTGRITNFRNWLPSLCGQSRNTIVCLEYWCNDDDALWTMADGDVAALARREMAATGLTGGAGILNAHIVRVGKSYPVYGHGYRQNLAPVEAFLSRFPRLHAIGRYGAFKYNNQDHSILMGVLAAENIIAADGEDGHPPRHDLWQVNTDTDYQEAGRITDTGLQKAAP
ncbi:FAD-dependent oxidoreductase [Nitrospirillum iridis]|uniref:Protoporphyrinogen oxidase n=1 Tax=Nitrospirillum iridis TaxID=765888 RepID=A0A7X0AVD4_9PROT|nr:FAD-dependent oxidoreductase [Nitrospirillum iridis]MBB6249790.1 protoporphyrinogen oxidase [Nitrospirillum iridis]